MKRLLIAFTGLDGSGKTTQAKLLIEGLQEKGISVHYVWSRWKPFLLKPLILLWKRAIKKNNGMLHEEYAEVKRNKQGLLKKPFFRLSWLMLFFIDYGAQIFFKVRLGTIGKKFIISDRISYDSVIDQAINLGEQQDILMNNLDSLWMRILFLRPDFVIYVDCPANIAFQRKDDAPSLEYLEERRSLYLKLAKRLNWLIMDGTLPIQEISRQILIKVTEKINDKNV